MKFGENMFKPEKSLENKNEVSLTEKQLYEASDILEIVGKDKIETEKLINEKADEFLESEPIKNIKEKKPGLIQKLAGSKFLKIAALTGSLLMAEVATSKDTFGQEKKEVTEQQNELESNDFYNINKLWQEIKDNKDTPSKIEDFDKKIVEFKEEEKKVLEHLAQVIESTKYIFPESMDAFNKFKNENKKINLKEIVDVFQDKMYTDTFGIDVKVDEEQNVFLIITTRDNKTLLHEFKLYSHEDDKPHLFGYDIER